MTDAELRRIEQAAAAIARKAGTILLSYFSGPLVVNYKSPNRRDAVTDADKASDIYIRNEVNRLFPDHTILSEEGTDDTNIRSSVTWIVDPLDGTNNFLNGMPVFGVSIGVVEGDRPVVGALFIPSIHQLENSQIPGNVYHARVGGGTHRDGTPIFLNAGEKPANSLLAGMPTYFSHAFKFDAGVRWNLGEVRSTGSVAFEMAMVCEGVLQYAVFNRPKIWDLAAGLVLVPETGGAIMVHKQSPRRWEHFDQFEVRSIDSPFSHGELGSWRPLIVAGTEKATLFITSGMHPRNYTIRRTWWRFKRLLKKFLTSQKLESTDQKESGVKSKNMRKQPRVSSKARKPRRGGKR